MGEHPRIAATRTTWVRGEGHMIAWCGDMDPHPAHEWRSKGIKVTCDGVVVAEETGRDDD